MACLTLIAALAAFNNPRALGAEFSIKVTDKPVPREIGESVRTVLQPKAVQLLDGEKIALEIWSRAELPLKSKPASGTDTLTAIGETALVAVISLDEGTFRDYKDNPIPKGIYTARFGLQPQDGDHLGTAEFNYFLVLLSAEADKELNGFTQFRPMVKASGKLTSSGHPVVVSLRPAPAAEAGTPTLTEPVAAHKAIRMKLSGKTPSGEKADVAFDLIYKGTGHIQ